MTRTSDYVLVVVTKKLRSNLESQNISHESRSFILCVPVVRDLSRIHLRQDRIEDRLLRQSWRKFAKPTRSYVVQLSLTHRPVQRRQWDSHLVNNTNITQGSVRFRRRKRL